MRTTFIGLSLFLALTLYYSSPASAERLVTFYLDGAVVEQDANARKGYLEIQLPTGYRADSLRIRPKTGTSIERVEISPVAVSRKLEAELALIDEKEELLHDRLKALAIKENIFKSAAKSQSAKAPKKTKNNPEPIKSIKQGTDYAIAQLEAVFQSKRRAEKELRQLEERRNRLKADGQVGGGVARIWLSTTQGGVKLFFHQNNRFWSPSYELRAVSGGKAKLSIFPGKVSVMTGERARVVLAPMESSSSSTSWEFAGQNRALQVKELEVAGKPVGALYLSPLTLLITNTTDLDLPPGELACYLDGEYFGAGKFAGLGSLKSINFDCKTQ